LRCAYIFALAMLITPDMDVCVSDKSIIKYSRATGRVKWLSDEKTNVSRVISVLVFWVLMCLENQSVPGIGLLVAWEYFIIQCRHESYKSYMIKVC
jgi:hypothetical protein